MNRVGGERERKWEIKSEIGAERRREGDVIAKIEGLWWLLSEGGSARGARAAARSGVDGGRGKQRRIH